MNVVTLIGNLASDVELRELGDLKLATFVLAIDRPGTRDKTDFVRIATWNKQAEVCGRFLAKGKRVAVDGRLRSRSWEDGEGRRRSSVEVVAASVQFLTPPDRPAHPAASFEAAAA